MDDDIDIISSVNSGDSDNSNMNLMRNGAISLKSFISGTGVLSYLILKYCQQWPAMPAWLAWLSDHPWSYPLFYFTIAAAATKLVYRQTDEWQVSICGCFLGVVFGSATVVVALDLYHQRLFASYIMVLAFFHFSEYYTTAATNPTNLTIDSYLLNHSLSYWLAAAASWLEYFLEDNYAHYIKTLWYVSVFGAVLCIFGELTRKLAMFTARKNFNHHVQVNKQTGHKLVTHGVYNWCRHPSYVGWFYWSVGTQVLLVNPVCIAIYATASWCFFNERIRFEEMTLCSFFKQDYLDYKKRVGTGLPFIKGYVVPKG